MALAAAFVLALQGLFGAFATGAANAGGMLDAFGNSLCITDMDGAGQPPHEGGDSVFPDCCTGLCGLVVPLTVAAPAFHSLFSPLVVSVKAWAPPRVMAFRSTPDHDPGRPRAPPFVA